jgi:hypothetical protein
MRSSVFIAFALSMASVASDPAIARGCKRGCPCGNACISCSKTCHGGGGSGGGGSGGGGGGTSALEPRTYYVAPTSPESFATPFPTTTRPLDHKSESVRLKVKSDIEATVKLWAHGFGKSLAGARLEFAVELPIESSSNCGIADVRIADKHYSSSPRKDGAAYIVDFSDAAIAEFKTKRSLVLSLCGYQLDVRKDSIAAAAGLIAKTKR